MEKSIPPWLVLLENLSFHPTFPLLIGALRAQELLPNSGDHFADGLLLLTDMEREQLLDEAPKKAVSIELCAALKVPVFHLRDRRGALYCRSLFPSTGNATGRVRFETSVVPEKILDLEECYDQFYYNLAFQHEVALEQERLSRDGGQWVTLEDSEQFDEAIEILEDHRDCLRAVAE